MNNNILKNSNGSRYAVLSRFDAADGSNVLLLAAVRDWDNLEAGGSGNPSQYIVCTNWSDRWQSWGQGHYFSTAYMPRLDALEDAKACYADLVEKAIRYI